MFSPTRDRFLTLSSAWLVLATGCASAGTVITATPTHLTVPRAVDQAILGDAIDAAFATVKIDEFSAALKTAGALSAIVEVESPFALPDAVIAYVRSRATMAAGLVGVGVLDTERVVERPFPNSPTEIAYLRRPDTGGRVVVAIAYCGVDDDVLVGKQDSPGSPIPDRVLRGRFKATVSIMPRRSTFTGVSQTIEGATSYDIINGKYLDHR